MKEDEFKNKALTITRKARGERHPNTAVCYHNIALMKAKRGDWGGASTETQRAIAIMLSLDLTQHPQTQADIRSLITFWSRSGQGDKAKRLARGEASDLRATIAQVEAEHRAWVAADPKNRHFGPPSPYE